MTDDDRGVAKTPFAGLAEAAAKWMPEQVGQAWTDSLDATPEAAPPAAPPIPKRKPRTRKNGVADPDSA